MPPVRIEGGDLGCGELLLVLHKVIKDLPPGTLVAIAATDPAAPIDLPAWCHLTGHEYVGPDPLMRGTDPPIYLVRLTDTPRPIDPRQPWRLVPSPNKATQES